MASVLSLIILGSLSTNPRVLIINGPKIMQETLKPLSADEMRPLNFWRVLILLIIFFAPLAIAIWYERTYQQFSYGEAWLFLWIIWMAFNLVDLLIIDCFVLLWWQPSWTLIPDAQPYSSYTDFQHHFRASLKGTVMMAVFALIYAGILMLI
jgi:hypothetical protein